MSNEEHNNDNDKSEIKIKSIALTKLENEMSDVDITITDSLRNFLFYLLCIEYSFPFSS